MNIDIHESKSSFQKYMNIDMPESKSNFQTIKKKLKLSI